VDTFHVEQNSATVTTLRIPIRRKAGWEQWGLLSSDRHFDNPKSRQDMQKRHLQQAKERGAFVMDFGDLFCAMQGNKDRRGKKGDIREENQKKDYFGSLVRSGVSLLDEYKDNLAVFGPGNHEMAILNHNEIDLTTALVERLQDRGSKVVRGGYRGWVRFLFEGHGGSYRQGVNLHYSHGSGGGGVVTKGVIQANRRAVWLPDAQIVVNGHIHEAWQVEYCRARITALGKEYTDEQLHICLPTYKDEFSGCRDGFHIEREAPPKPLGAWWLRFFWDAGKGRVNYEATRAK
jgi:hypothetical protein